MKKVLVVIVVIIAITSCVTSEIHYTTSDDNKPEEGEDIMSIAQGDHFPFWSLTTFQPALDHTVSKAGIPGQVCMGQEVCLAHRGFALRTALLCPSCSQPQTLISKCPWWRLCRLVYLLLGWLGIVRSHLAALGNMARHFVLFHEWVCFIFRALPRACYRI